eukprot:TRINITY_DN16456_c0_g1_i4.p1 TRINITY_DN16456_c0_g1~~TRINITY_DN16456_c0_g1_i4.p1  ORF type:complete len:1258 (-),score=177.74 TRINITY_DN16456_c0_g1_i4:16-3510(-)
MDRCTDIECCDATTTTSSVSSSRSVTTTTTETASTSTATSTRTLTLTSTSSTSMSFTATSTTSTSSTATASTKTSTSTTTSKTMTTVTLAEGTVGAYLTQAASAGETVVLVSGTNGFNQGDFVSIEAGANDEEIGKIAGLTESSITLKNGLKFGHPSKSVVVLSDEKAALEIALQATQKQQKAEVSSILSLISSNVSANVTGSKLAQQQSVRDDGARVATVALAAVGDEEQVTVDSGEVTVAVPLATLRQVQGGSEAPVVLNVVVHSDNASETSEVLAAVTETSGQTLQSSPVALDFFDQDGNKIKVTFEEPMLFKLSDENASEDIQCAFFDEDAQRWSTEGVSRKTGGELQGIWCLTYHLSIFGAIADAFVATFVCSNALLIFSIEGLTNLTKGSWWSELAAIVNWCILLLGLSLLVLAKYDDERDKSRSELHIGESLRMQELMNTSVHNVMLARTREKTSSETEVHEHLERFKHRGESLSRNLSSNALASQQRPWWSPKSMLDWVAKRAVDEVVANKTGSTIKVLGRTYLNLGCTDLHTQARSVAEEFIASSPCFQLRSIFVARNKWLRVLMPDFGMSCAQRAAVVLAELYGSFSVSAVFYGSGAVTKELQENPLCQKAAEDLLFQLVRTVVVSLVSTIIGSLPVLGAVALVKVKSASDKESSGASFLEMLGIDFLHRSHDSQHRRVHKKSLREKKVPWWQSKRLYFTALLCFWAWMFLYFVFSLGVVCIFLASVSVADADTWMRTSLLSTVSGAILTPLFITLFILIAAMATLKTDPETLLNKRMPWVAGASHLLEFTEFAPEGELFRDHLKAGLYVTVQVSARPSETISSETLLHGEKCGCHGKATLEHCCESNVLLFSLYEHLQGNHQEHPLDTKAGRQRRHKLLGRALLTVVDAVSSGYDGPLQFYGPKGGAAIPFTLRIKMKCVLEGSLTVGVEEPPSTPEVHQDVNSTETGLEAIELLREPDQFGSSCEEAFGLESPEPIQLTSSEILLQQLEQLREMSGSLQVLRTPTLSLSPRTPRSALALELIAATRPTDAKIFAERISGRDSWRNNSESSRGIGALTMPSSAAMEDVAFTSGEKPSAEGGRVGSTSGGEPPAEGGQSARTSRDEPLVAGGDDVKPLFAEDPVQALLKLSEARREKSESRRALASPRPSDFSV